MFTTVSSINIDQLSPCFLKQALLDSVNTLKDNIELYYRQPGKDFTRSNTKLGVVGFAWHLICMGAKDTRSEINDIVPLDVRAYTDAAVGTTENKLRADGMEFLFHDFTNKLSYSITLKDDELCDVDGMDLNIYLNPDDKDTYVAQKEKSGYNQLHINVIFDPLTNVALDIEIDTKHKKNEANAFLKMFNSWSDHDQKKRIFICDRGYISYSLIDFMNRSGAKYILRAKDQFGKSIFSRIGLPDGEYDMTIPRILTRKHNKKYLNDRKTYAVLQTYTKFDFPDGIDEYPLTFRIVRFRLSSGEWKIQVTNLPEDEFSTSDMKDAYHLRWNIEGHNKQIKYDQNLVALHSRKQEYARQEIYARYILANFTHAVTSAADFILERIDFHKRANASEVRNLLNHAMSGENIDRINDPPSYAQYTDEPMIFGQNNRQRERPPVYKIDFSSASTAIRMFLKCRSPVQDEDIIARILKDLVLVKPDRKYNRDVKPQSFRKFSYRGA